MPTNKHSPAHTVVVGCLVRNDNNEVLLVRHLKRGWEIPQGRVEEGENLVDALNREVMEEAGIEIEVGPLAAVWSMISQPSALIFAFLCNYVSGEPSGSGDCTDACWFSEEDALEKVSSTVMQERLMSLMDFKGSIIYRSYSINPYKLQSEMNIGCCGSKLCNFLSKANCS